MAATTAVSVEEYLRMSFDGADCDYVDGEIVERNVGEKPHSKAQLHLIGVFLETAQALGLCPLPELRLRIAPRRFRVADLAVFREEPAENVPSSPPLIVVEIVSRDDRYTEIIEKFEDYRTWGVPHIWLVDPWLRKLYVYRTAGLSEVPAYSVPELDVEIPAAAIF
jgi:Uma2 family endonuclease